MRSAINLKIFLLIAVISAGIYANSLQNSFHFDDQHYIVENPYIRDLSNIPSFFKSPRLSSFEKTFSGHYRPLLVTSYAVNYAIGGLGPAGYHAVNLAFHAGAAYLLFLILEAMLGRVGVKSRNHSHSAIPSARRSSFNTLVKPGNHSHATPYSLTPLYAALAASLIFAVNPFNSEVVNYITARSSVMSSFFYLLSFYFWVKFRRQTAEDRQPTAEGVDNKNVEHLEPGNSPLIAHRSPLIAHRSPLIAHRSPLIAHRSPLIAHRSPLIAHRSSLIALFYLTSILAFVLALLTKEIAITLPVMLFLYDYYFHRPEAKAVIQPSPHKKKGRDVVPGLENVPASDYSQEGPSAGKIPASCCRPSVAGYLAYLPYILIVVLPYILYSNLTVSRLTGGGTRDFLANLLTQPKVLLNYVQLIVFPLGLTIEHDIRISHTLYDVTVILSIIALLLIAGAAYLLFRRGGEWRVLSFFIAWFFITLLPTTMVPLNAILQENRGYLAGAGLAVFAGICVGRMPRRVFIPVLLSMVSVYSVVTIQRNPTWRDGYSLWADAVAKHPSSARAHDNLGLAYLAKGDYELAINEFKKTLELHPRYYLAHYNAGVAYQLQNKLEMARASYEEGIKINPGYFRSYYNLGIVYRKTGELDKAIAAYESAISLDARHPFVYNNLGVALTDKGETDKAVSVFKRSIEIDPEYVRAYYNLGNIYYGEGKYDLAAEVYQSALNINPDYKEAQKMLDSALKMLR